MVTQDSKITIDRATVEQALEALDTLCRSLSPESVLAADLKRRADPLRAALEQPEQDPIGWLDGTDRLSEFMHRDLKADHEKRGSTMSRYFTTPVYLAPPAAQQRKPLTDEQIEEIWVEHGCEGEDACGFARAIEAAHGIKEPKP